MPTLEEVHLGLGSGEVTFDYDPELLAELLPYRHLIFYKDAKRLGATVILARTPSRQGITISGYGLGFWLSVDNDGAVIDRREYIAGNDQLSNGGFETLDALGFPELWSISEGSTWAADETDTHAGTRAMRVTGDLGKDDVLVSTQPRDLSPGALVRASAWFERLSGAIGRCRLRAVFEGRFDPTDLLPGLGAWVDASDTPGDTAVDGSTIRIGPTTQPQYLLNPGFETGDLSGWTGNTGVDPGDGLDKWLADTSAAGPVYPHSGTYMAVSFVVVPPGTDETIRYLDNDATVHCTAGEKYVLDGYIIEAANTLGEATIYLAPSVEMGTTTWIGAPSVHGTNWYTAGPVAGQWKQCHLEYTVPDGIVELNVLLFDTIADDGTGLFLGEFGFDDITLTRVAGNIARRRCETDIPVTPERTYKLLAPFHAEDSCTQGTAKFRVVLGGTGRDDQVVESGTVDYQAKGRTLLSMDITPPSGYDRIRRIDIVGTDVIGGTFVVEEKPVLVDQDTSTKVVDVKTPAAVAAWTQYALNATAPAGTQKLHLEVVAEAAATGFVVDDVEWHRREAITPSATIVDQLLRDPDTGDYLVGPGTIHSLPASGWDWLLINQPQRTALLQFLRGGRLSPLLEFRHNADNTLDVGTAEQLFMVRDSFVFVEPDLLLLDFPEVASTVEDRLTRVKLIGAALQRRAPLPDAVITGLAETTIPDAYDWFGNPVRRTRIVVDSAVDYQAFADGRAQDELDHSSDSSEVVTLGISDWSAWGTFAVGDWLNAYKPEALLEDRSNPMNYKGRRIFPARKRALSRKLTMARGDGFAVKVRRPDGTEIDVSRFVRWADKTSATLELGEQRQDFANDPQGPAAGQQYLRARAAAAR